MRRFYLKKNVLCAMIFKIEFADNQTYILKINFVR